jgi:hypothetical protein
MSNRSEKQNTDSFSLLESLLKLDHLIQSRSSVYIQREYQSHSLPVGPLSRLLEGEIMAKQRLGRYPDRSAVEKTFKWKEGLKEDRVKCLGNIVDINLQ